MQWLEERVNKVKDFLSPKNPADIMGVPLGKFSELDRTQAQLNALDKADELFDQKGKFIESINASLDFVLDEQHIKGSYKELEPGQWEFLGMHGSVLLHGRYSNSEVLVEALLLRGGSFKPSMLRQLLEASISYDFINYGINDSDEVVVQFYLNSVEANPDIFVAALKELCLSADFYDSKFSTDFHDMHWVSMDHVIFDSEDIFEKKYNLYHEELKEITDYLKKLDAEKDRNLIHAAYRMLGYLYKSDFLISPRNYLFGLYIDILNQYWFTLNKEPNNFLPAVSALKESLEDQLVLSKEEFKNEAVNLPYLFSTRDEFNFNAIQSAVQTHLPNIRTYSAEGDKTHQYWCTHTLLGIIVFHQDIDHVWKDWIYYLYCLTDGHYLNSLGYIPNFMTDDQSQVNTEEIKKRLAALIEANKERPRPLPPLPEDLTNSDPLDMVMHILGVFV